MIQELYALERLSSGNSYIHRLNPIVKLLATMIFIITVVSFDRYAFGRLMPYIFYPTLLMALSGTPYSMLLKRFLIALPFCFFAGLTNIIFDKSPAFAIGNITVSYGTVSFFSILFRTYLCVMAVLLLISITPFSEITNSMHRLRIPGIFIVMFEMTYRYIGVLFAEAYSMYIAYSLRNSGQKGIAMNDMGSFAGHLLLRSFNRADCVYNAMKCRGYTLGASPRSERKIERKDLIFCIVTCLLCITFRVIDINALFAGILG
jgi:cobalt/nickel transport system permease protein